MAGHAFQHDRRVANIAGQRAGLIKRRRERHDAPARAPAIGRLHADNAAEAAGLTDRAAGIGAGRRHRQARGHRRCRASGGATGHQARIPAILTLPGAFHRAVIAGHVGRAHGELVHVELAQHHRPVAPQIAGDGRFILRPEPVEDVRAGGGRDTLGAEQVLDPERDTVKRQRVARGQTRIGGTSHLAGLIRRRRHIAVQVLRGLHRLEIGIGQFGGGHLSLGKRVPRRREVKGKQIGHHSTTFGTE